jgi:hypothetical protein
VPSRYRNLHFKFLVMQGFFMHSIRILAQPQSYVLCINIIRRVEQGLMSKESDIKNINSFRLDEICKPFTVKYSLLIMRRFQFLQLCYLVWEEVQFFSNRFMLCWKPHIFLLRNDFYGLPLRSASNTEPVARNFSISLRNALPWGTGVSGNCRKIVVIFPSQVKLDCKDVKNIL